MFGKLNDLAITSDHDTLLGMFYRAELDAFKAHLGRIASSNIFLAPKAIDFDSEGAARLALLKKCPHGGFALADPDGTLIDVEEDH